MDETRQTPRWPIIELIILTIFPLLFGGPDPIQQAYGHLPHWIQFMLPFTLAGIATLSSARLTSRARRAKRKGLAALCAACLVLGCLALAVATLLMFGLGAGPWAFGLLALGFLPAVLIVYSKELWRLSNKTLLTYF